MVLIEIIWDCIGICFWVIYDILNCLYELYFGKWEKICGKTVFITGAAGGVGKSLCEVFSDENCNLVITDVEQKYHTLSEIKTTIKKKHPHIRIDAYAIDLNKINDLETNLAEIKDKHTLDIIILNAATNATSQLVDINVVEFQKVLNINFVSNAIILKTFLPSMYENNYGHVVAVSSILSYHSEKYHAPYCASKSALNSLMECAREEAHVRKAENIKFHTILPSKIDTPLFSHIIQNEKFAYILPLIQPIEVAKCILKSVCRNWEQVNMPTFSIFLMRVAQVIIPGKSFRRFIRYLTE